MWESRRGEEKRSIHTYLVVEFGDGCEVRGFGVFLNLNMGKYSLCHSLFSRVFLIQEVPVDFHICGEKLGINNLKARLVLIFFVCVPCRAQFFGP